MTIRAALLGCLLGLFIAGFTYFNDHVIRQTYLINNHLPASVFGVGVVLILGVNPLLRRLGPGAPLRPVEIALVLMMGLAVCGWPGTSFFRFFTHLMAMPAHRLQQQPDWQATGVLSYVPGGSPMIAEGHLIDGDGLLTLLRDPPAGDAAVGYVARVLGEDIRTLGRSPDGRLTPAERSQLIRSLNRMIADPQFVQATPIAEAIAQLPEGVRDSDDPQRLARRVLEATYPEHIRPQAPGSGVLLADGRFDPDVTAPLLTGLAGTSGFAADAVPWRVWWPTIRLWGGVAVLTTLAVLCLAVIVHPQWSGREMLPYPTVRLVQELTRSSESGGSGIPSLLGQRLFWLGLGGVMFIHTVNGLHAWFPSFPQVPLQLQLGALGQLFPQAQRVPGFWALVTPWVFPAAVGFGYFIQTRTAMSLGLSLFLWVVVGSALLSRGIALGEHRYGLHSEGPALRAGAYLGLALMILYVGRRYYTGVALRAVGLGRNADVPGYAAGAAWAMLGLLFAAGWMLWNYASLSAGWAAVLLFFVLVASLVLMRLNAETGLFYAQPDWHVPMVLTGLVGLPFVGPTPLIVLMIGSALLMPDPREGFSPYLLNALRLGDGVGNIAPQRGGKVLAAMIVTGFAVALVATLGLQYARGLDAGDSWAPSVPRDTIGQVSQTLTQLSVRDELDASVGLGGADRLGLFEPDRATLTCLAVGFAVVLVCAAGRLRWAWWPLHPALFAVWGTYAANIFAASFLLAALIKWATVRLGGERLHASLKPLMIGLIAGELASILMWAVVGTVYFAVTGHTPSVTYIYPQ